MTRYLFEAPLVLTLVLIAIWSALFIRWRLTRSRGRAFALGVSLLVGAAALAMNLLVVTDREVAEGLLNRLVKDVEREGLAAALPYVSPQFNDHHGTDYDGLKKDLTVISSRLPLSGVQLTDWQVERDRLQQLDVHFIASGVVTLSGTPRPFGPDRWQVVLDRDPASGSWQIVSAWLVEGHVAGAPQITNFRDLVTAVQMLKSLGLP